MILKGLQKLTLLDFPGRIAATVFTGGCNFRCPFCHNASLVIPERLGEDLPEEELFAFLEKRRGVLEGVCITGGEPTLHKDLPKLLERIKKLGFLTKLDTNGTNPVMLEELIDHSLVDYVAMDIKSSREGYPSAIGIDRYNTKTIEESIEILKKCKVDFEFRTTMVKELHSDAHIEEIGKWLNGEEKFFLQSFRDSGDLIAAKGYSAYDDGEMNRLLTILKQYIPKASLR